MKNSVLILIFLALCFSTPAQRFAEEKAYVYTDKDNYLAGEEILVKFRVTDADFQPSLYSRVGYIEICDTQKPHIQTKLALTEGCGYGRIAIPDHLPSGIYRLTAYTRYMRNLGEESFFSLPIAILNMGRSAATDSIRISEVPLDDPLRESTGIRVRTNEKRYSSRSQVRLYLENMPSKPADLTVTVYRNDSLVSISRQETTQKGSKAMPVSAPLRWLPEMEGHIIDAKLSPENPGTEIAPYLTFVGDDITIISGQSDRDNGSVSFHTQGVFGTREVVTTAYSANSGERGVKVDIVSPFHTSFPRELPGLTVYKNNKALTERSIASQITKIIQPDSNATRTSSTGSYFYFPKPATYNLDEYTRFPTLAETFIEFIWQVRVGNDRGKEVIRIFQANEKRFNPGASLVLLDGVFVSDHEKLLGYDPKHIRSVKIYDGRYLFGGNTFGGIVSFQTYRKDLPFFRLPDDSQLFIYECPTLPEPIDLPDYSDAIRKASRKPDFRHTLYWNPDVSIQTGEETKELAFYTSDLCGEFRVVVRGFTGKGEEIYGECRFRVVP